MFFQQKFSFFHPTFTRKKIKVSDLYPISRQAWKICPPFFYPCQGYLVLYYVSYQ
ncbi:unnamed protein product [Callosobruchus maculatus]|uniref:Uncharacterized protein n=1 Tax=Callosobruchus maculatus TaxID=64391 RepID=A0A653DQV0_CALMS|nr:unnamed protein product [Callosobruchus maculatus]